VHALVRAHVASSPSGVQTRVSLFSDCVREQEEGKRKISVEWFTVRSCLEDFHQEAGIVSGYCPPIGLVPICVFNAFGRQNVQRKGKTVAVLCCLQYYRHVNMSRSFVFFVTFGSVNVKLMYPKAITIGKAWPSVL